MTPASKAEARAVWALALGQMIGYGCLFYLFAALVLTWQQVLGWDHRLIAAGPLVAVTVTALLAPQVGRAVDRGFAPRLLALGAVIGAGALVVLATATHPAQFLLAFAGMGVAQAISLYEVCFGLMIRRFGAGAQKQITQVTLIAGLASTFAFPAGAWVAAHFGWRAAVWGAAALVLLVMLPLHLWGARVLAAGIAPDDRSKTRTPVRWRAILALPGIGMLMLMFFALNLDHWMLIGLMRPLLADLGQPEGQAVLAAAAIGPAQVLGRLALMAAGARVSAARVTVWTMAAALGASLALALAIPKGGLAIGAVLVFSALQGAAMGIATILRPVLVSDVAGSADFGSASALVSLPGLGAMALAPMLGTSLMGMGGAAALIVLSVLLSALTLGLAVARR